jgi:hypothetical protein
MLNKVQPVRSRAIALSNFRLLLFLIHFFSPPALVRATLAVMGSITLKELAV